MTSLPFPDLREEPDPWKDNGKEKPFRTSDGRAVLLAFFLAPILFTYESDPAPSPTPAPLSLRSCESRRAAARFDPNPGRPRFRLVPFQFGPARPSGLRPPLLHPFCRPLARSVYPFVLSPLTCS